MSIIDVDEMHTYINSRKTTDGYGLPLIDMEENSSTAYLAVVEQIQERDYGET